MFLKLFSSTALATLVILCIAADTTPARASTGSEHPTHASEHPAADGPDTEHPEDADTEPPEEADTEDPEGSETNTRTVTVHEEIEVRGRGTSLLGVVGSAGEGATSYVQLQTRPILRPGDLVETTPGVVATQHSGGGKANQFFLRGFNLDHGTDFSVHVAGVPVNMPSHGHGQGYADLNFLIPEIVSSAQYRKGPYFAEAGDFSAAGSLEIELMDKLPERFLEFSGGSDEYGRLLWADGSATENGNFLGAVEVFQENGPWTREEQYEGWKAYGRYSTGDAARGYRLTFLGYDADWLSTDQVPRRAVDSGLIDRFDLIDDGPRGSTERFSLAFEGHRSQQDSLTRWRVYALSYDFRLISNFTYFLENPEEGDQFEQVDDRRVAGGDVRHHWHGTIGGREFEALAGFQARYDDVSNGLFRTTDLARFGTVRSDEIQQLGLGTFTEALVHWSDTVRTRIGLRADYADVDTTSNNPINSGSDDDLIVSPKISLILSPWDQTELYFNYGRGFHSNDARGATVQIDPASGESAESVDLLVPADGFDVGLRTSPLPDWQMTLTLFQLELDSELIFVGDGGATEASRPSRRRGLEWTNYWQISDTWTADFDFTYTDSELTDDDPAGNEIPGAVGRTVAAGVSYDRDRWFASLRHRYFGDVPLIEDGSVVWDSSSVTNLRLGYRFPIGVDVSLKIFNLFDREASDVEYFYASRLPGEPVDGVEDIHFHPMPERSARLLVSWRY